MCVTPTNLPDKGLVACRYCWQCRANRVNDYVGRCIAEQQHSKGSLAVTLTYAEDEPNAATLVYADFQKFMKRLRKAGYSVRYMVAGEYGSLKGRAHWHAVLFFNDKVPQVEIEQRINWKYWPHGFAYFQEAHHDGFSYLLKYALKNEAQEVNVGHLAMSKKPPLGTAYFLELADRYVKQGLSPQTYSYSFPDVFDRSRRRRKFMVQGKMRELFLERYLTRYQEVHNRLHPYSELVEEFEDSRVDLDASRTDEEWVKLLADKQRPMQPELEVYLSTEGEDFLGTREIQGTLYGIPVAVTLSPSGVMTVDTGVDKKWRTENAEHVKRVFKDMVIHAEQSTAQRLDHQFYGNW